MATFQQWKPSQYTNMNETKKAHVDSGFEARGGDRQTYKTLGSALNPSSPRGEIRNTYFDFEKKPIRIHSYENGQFFTKINFCGLEYNAKKLP